MLREGDWTPLALRKLHLLDHRRHDGTLVDQIGTGRRQLVLGRLSPSTPDAGLFRRTAWWS
jgi:hypothetical protein